MWAAAIVIAVTVVEGLLSCPWLGKPAKDVHSQILRHHSSLSPKQDAGNVWGTSSVPRLHEGCTCHSLEVSVGKGPGLHADAQAVRNVALVSSWKKSLRVSKAESLRVQSASELPGRSPWNAASQVQWIIGWGYCISMLTKHPKVSLDGSRLGDRAPIGSERYVPELPHSTDSLLGWGNFRGARFLIGVPLLWSQLIPNKEHKLSFYSGHRMSYRLSPGPCPILIFNPYDLLSLAHDLSLNPNCSH